MIYNEVCGEKLSSLGLGTLRLPTVNGEDSCVDYEMTREMISYALSNGINYIDTAYGYHGGNAETVVGAILKEHDRDSFFLATKFPGFAVETMNKVDQIFEEQLSKCQVDYFDFYLLHNVNEANIEMYLSEDNHVISYLLEQKHNGRIKHIGFSTHGKVEVMRRFLDNYGDAMEFCQIQLNYLDWNYQNAKEKCKLIKEYNLPVWVMEPVRGGALATTTDEWKSKLKAYRNDEDIPAWAFRFLQAIPEVKMTLSGMSTMQQLKNNIDTFSEFKPLNDEEFELVIRMADERINSNILPCTSCRYCVGVCPNKIEIPKIFSWYNRHAVAGGYYIAPFGIVGGDKKKSSLACLNCKKCESVCPQNIKISDVFADINGRIEWR